MLPPTTTAMSEHITIAFHKVISPISLDNK